MGIVGEPLGDAPWALGRPRRPLVAGLQHHVFDPDRLPLPRAPDLEPKPVAERVVAEVARREEVVVRHDADGGGRTAAVEGEEGEDLAVAPVAAHRGRLHHEGHVEQGNRDVRDAEHRRAHLDHPGDDQQHAAAVPQARRERAEAQAREDSGDWQERQRVAKILVLEELEECKRWQDRREEEPVAPPGGHAEPEDEEEDGDEPELHREPARVQHQRRSRQRLGVARLRRLSERAARDLGGQPEKPRAIPGQTEPAADQRGQREVRKRAARSDPRGDHHERRQHVGRERRLGQHAEPQDQAGRDGPAAMLERVGAEQDGEHQRDH